LILILLIFFVSCIYRGDDKNDPISAQIFYTILQPRSILIIGDSLTERSGGFFLHEFSHPDTRIFYKGIVSSDFLEWRFRMNEAFAMESFPDQVIVALGTNDAYKFNLDIFKINFEQFHSQLRLITSAEIYYILVPLTIEPQLTTVIQKQNQFLRNSPPPGIAGLIDAESAFLNAPTVTPLYLHDIIHPTDDGYRLIGFTISRSINL